MKKYFPIAAGLGAVLAMGTWLMLENRHLAAELRQTQRALQATKPQREPGNQPAGPQVAQSPALVQASASSNADPGAQPNQNPVQALKMLWDNPVWRANRFNEAILHVEAKYGRFFSAHPDWSTEKVESLKRLLANGELAIERAALPQAYPGTESDRAVAAEALRVAIENSQQQLGATLGDADYAKFDAAEKMEPYRESVGAITNAMRSKNISINGEMEESILSAYSAAIQEAAHRAEPVDFKSLSETQRAALKKQQLDAFHTLLVQKMSGVLDEKQLNAFLETELEQSGGG